MLLSLDGTGYGPKADMFSFGVMVAELVCKYVIPPDRGVLTTERTHIKGMVDAASLELTAAAPGLSALLQCCILDKGPRPDAAQALQLLRLDR